MGRLEKNQYYYRINDRIGRIERVKETGSRENHRDYELGNCYESYEEAALNF